MEQVGNNAGYGTGREQSRAGDSTLLGKTMQVGDTCRTLQSYRVPRGQGEQVPGRLS